MTRFCNFYAKKGEILLKERVPKPGKDGRQPVKRFCNFYAKKGEILLKERVPGKECKMSVYLLLACENIWLTNSTLYEHGSSV